MAIGASTAAAIAQAIKASGAIVHLEAREFEKLAHRAEAPLIVRAGVGKRKTSYLMNHRGLFFYTKTGDRLSFPMSAEFVDARKIWMP